MPTGKGSLIINLAADVIRVWHEDHLQLQQTLPGGRRPPHPAVPWALAEIRDNPAASRVSPLADATGLSQRRFIQLFKQQVGSSIMSSALLPHSGPPTTCPTPPNT